MMNKNPRIFMQFQNTPLLLKSEIGQSPYSDTDLLVSPIDYSTSRSSNKKQKTNKTSTVTHQANASKKASVLTDNKEKEIIQSINARMASREKNKNSDKIYGEMVSSELSDLPDQIKHHVEHEINNILYKYKITSSIKRVKYIIIINKDWHLQIVTLLVFFLESNNVQYNRPQHATFTNTNMTDMLPPGEHNRQQNIENTGTDINEPVENSGQAEDSDMLFNPDRVIGKVYQLVYRKDHKLCPQGVKRCEICVRAFVEEDIVVVKTVAERRFCKDSHE